MEKQTKQIIYIDTLIEECAALAVRLQNLSHTTAGSSQQLPDTHLHSAYLCLVEAMHNAALTAATLRTERALTVATATHSQH